MSHKALFTAKLLAGTVPSEIEQVADNAGISLFPSKASDLVVDCSCPDYSNPCKHVAAVYYLLAETFNRDPFLLFKLRGLERETIKFAIEGHTRAARRRRSRRFYRPPHVLGVRPDPQRPRSRSQSAGRGGRTAVAPRFATLLASQRANARRARADVPKSEREEPCRYRSLEVMAKKCTADTVEQRDNGRGYRPRLGSRIQRTRLQLLRKEQRHFVRSATSEPRCACQGNPYGGVVEITRTRPGYALFHRNRY